MVRLMVRLILLQEQHKIFPYLSCMWHIGAGSTVSLSICLERSSKQHIIKLRRLCCWSTLVSPEWRLFILCFEGNPVSFYSAPCCKHCYSDVFGISMESPPPGLLGILAVELRMAAPAQFTQKQGSQ